METKKGFEIKFEEVCEKYMLDANAFAAKMYDIMGYMYDEMPFTEYETTVDAFSGKPHIASAINSMMSYFASIVFSDKLDKFMVIPIKDDEEIANWKVFLKKHIRQ